MASKDDIVGQWFQALAENGGDVAIRFGRISAPGADPAWSYKPHSDFDGIGAFIALMREEGVHTTAPTANFAGPTVWSVVRGCGRFLLDLRRRYRWSPLPGQDSASSSGPPTAVAADVLSEEQTSRVLANAKQAGVSANTLLLAALSDIVRERLLNGRRVISWVMPVNVRGLVPTSSNPVGNHSTFADVDCVAGEALTELHQRIRQSIAQGRHWAYWFVFKAGWLFGRWGRRAFMRIAANTPPRWIGSFSNLGRWDVSSNAHGWCFMPPPARSQPIGAGCITVNGRMGLAIQLHGSITTDHTIAQEWLRAWEATLID